MVAAAFALQGESVDIVTSSAVLAQRDCEQWKSFFDYLAVTVGCNETTDASCYSNKVVYGTIGSLLEIFCVKNSC
jgi:preprotein translocase subunit SecA